MGDAQLDWAASRRAHFALDATYRNRSEGVLSPEDVAYCRSNGIPLAYDPVQIGWVTASCRDDLLDHARPGRGVTPKLSFRAWMQDDVATYARYLSDQRIWRHMPESFTGRVDLAAAADLIRLNADQSRHVVQAILADGQPVGQVRVQFGIDPRNARVAETSYWLNPTHWGRGIASQAVARFTQELFATRSDIFQLIARVHEDNAASASVARKAGYRPAGADADRPGWHVYRADRAGA